ncbi:Methionine--tRNA ligase [Candidatus Gugararchaeum adminiculabundum]|nr:Methionine--tRNA ligase [Candidatus Gugararchaeum adminiculabundum]
MKNKVMNMAEEKKAEVKVAEEKKVEIKLEGKPTITYDDFSKVDLRVALIKSAEKVPNADKLLKLEIDAGDATGPRQLVAGIATSYSPEQLIGKKIILVANLAPRKIRGLESQGMLLAADAEGGPVLLTIDAQKDVPQGTKIM